MLDRRAARPSTAPGPGPRAGRCAAAAPRTQNARRDPGPIVGSLRRLGWGRVHDTSRPGGSGAGTARRGALDRHSPARRHARTAPGPACYPGPGHAQLKSPREVTEECGSSWTFESVLAHEPAGRESQTGHARGGSADRQRSSVPSGRRGVLWVGWWEHQTGGRICHDGGGGSGAATGRRSGARCTWSWRYSRIGPRRVGCWPIG
jgi:hypothetical protein